MLVINSAEPELGLILYINRIGYGAPCRLKEAERCELRGPRKAVLTLVGQQYYELKGTIEFVPEDSPLPGVYAVPALDQFRRIDIRSEDGYDGFLFVWRFRLGYRPVLPY